MTEKKGKRAVIISNIKSNCIEQAIFILKSPSYEEARIDVGGGIVAEAQEIINSYINTMERAQLCRKRKDFGKVAVLAGILCVGLLTAAILAIIF